MSMLLLLLGTEMAAYALPQQLSQQGRLMDAAGAAVTEYTRLFGLSGCSVSWVERITAVAPISDTTRFIAEAIELAQKVCASISVTSSPLEGKSFRQGANYKSPSIY